MVVPIGSPSCMVVLERVISVGALLCSIVIRTLYTDAVLVPPPVFLYCSNTQKFGDVISAGVQVVPQRLGKNIYK